MKDMSTKRAVGIIINDEKVLLIHRFCDGREYYVFPGGGVDENETVEDAVKRELKEELGIEITLGTLLFHHPNTAFGRTREEFYFLVTEFNGTPQWIGETVHEEQTETNRFKPVWVNVSKIKNLDNLYPEIAKQKLIKYLANILS
ncbi:MAG TPA: NUDIX domain-containing protein [bacterium]|nr:NUDIX domain-containing protein [bacterium]